MLECCQAATAAEGFRRLELVATMAGRPLYTRFGFVQEEQFTDTSSGVTIPLMRW